MSATSDQNANAQSENVVWQKGDLARDERWRSTGQRGATVWLTGLPASGKSTIASALESALVAAGRVAYRLDGDNLRHRLCGDLGFTEQDREENVRRTAEVARLLADAGVVAIVAVVSPYRAARDVAREMHAVEGLRFVEVFVDTPLDVCIDRDPKGLYAKAMAGNLDGMTGIDAPYERAEEAELRLSGTWSPTDVAADLMDLVGTA